MGIFTFMNLYFGKHERRILDSCPSNFYILGKSKL